MMLRFSFVDDLNKTVIVFDLDDTLFSEVDYQLSGYKAIQSKIQDIYGEDVSFILQGQNKRADVLGDVCKELALPDSVKESLLWLYRLHFPDIKLDSDIKLLLDWLEENTMAIAILTDGRSITQRLKLMALGLERFEAYVSEEWQESKPSLKRFNAIKDKYPKAKRFLYVGDNLKKDFIAPNALNWLTVGVRDQGRNIHSQSINVDSPTCLPKVWINNLSELNQILC